MTRSIVLRRNEQVLEGIPDALIHEAIRALPDEAQERKTLQKWGRLQSELIVSVEEISQILEGLSEYTHTSQSEMGEVEQLPYEALGLIISGEDAPPIDKNMINTTAVLSLAFRRLLTLVSIGAEIVVMADRGLIDVS